MEKKKQFIILTTGKEDRGAKATIAFALAVTFQALGLPTTIYLTLNGSVWAREKAAQNVHIGGFEPLADYILQFVENGGKILACPACTEFYVSAGDQEAVSCAGLATIAAEAAESTVLTF